MLIKKRDNTKTVLEIIDVLRIDKISKREFEEISHIICQEYEVTALFPETKPLNLASQIWISARCEEVPKTVTKALEEFFSKISIANGKT